MFSISTPMRTELLRIAEIRLSERFSSVLLSSRSALMRIALSGVRRSWPEHGDELLAQAPQLIGVAQFDLGCLKMTLRIEAHGNQLGERALSVLAMAGSSRLAGTESRAQRVPKKSPLALTMGMEM
jgi:hypothetical protein